MHFRKSLDNFDGYLPVDSMDHFNTQFQLLLRHAVFLFGQVHQKISSQRFTLVNVTELKHFDDSLIDFIVIQVITLSL